MKAATVSSPGRVSMVDLPRPVPAQGEVLVKMRCCGVCGTDVEKVRGEGITTRILGHEVVGEVQEVGEGVSGISPGMRVFTHHHVPCNSCEVCNLGKRTYCREFLKHNLEPCGLAEYYTVPRFNVERGAVLPLPETLGYEEASFIEPLACCILGLETAGAENARSAVIYGAGPVGLLHLKLLRHAGVERIAVADVSEYRLSFANRTPQVATFNPAQPHGKEAALQGFGDGPELAVVATGSPAALEDAMRTVSRGGRVLLFGAPKKSATAQIDLSRFFLNGTALVTSYSASERETKRALALLADHALDVSDLITHRFSLAETELAFATAAQQQCVKALIVN